MPERLGAGAPELAGYARLMPDINLSVLDQSPISE
ncbi:MAG: hypothetical protein QOF65_2782, partial [Thermoleophilaceae bacterium]|nr:hypothetical protein [Thermoleophilaceae bacterium]